MKRTLTTTLALLLMCIVPHSHGMSGDELGRGRVFDPVSWLTSLTRPFKRQRREGETVQLQIPLTSLERQRRIETKEQLPLSQPSSSSQVGDDEELAQQTSSQLSLTDALEYEAEQKDCIEQLPLEVFHKYIAPHLSTEDLKHIASVSRACRTLAQFSITHLNIKLEEITKEKLEDIKCKFSNIKSLAIRGRLVKLTHIELLAQEFPDLEALDLSGTGMNNQEIEALSQSGAFPKLKILNISGPINDSADIYTNDYGIAALAHASFVNELEELNLYNTGLSVEGVRKLFQPGIFKLLKKLNLGNNWIEDSAIEVLAEAPFAKQLEELDLSGTCLTKVGVASLSKADGFPALKVLNLGRNPIRDAGLKALQHAPFAGLLESLDLKQTRITAAGVTELAQSGKFKSLKNLSLASNAEFSLTDDECNETLGDTAVKSLAGTRLANQLESLNVYGTHLTQEGVGFLVQPDTFKSLKRLNMGLSDIKHENIGTVLVTIMKAPFANQLESLGLAAYGITAEETKLLAQQEAFKSLKRLDLQWNNLGDAGIEILVQAPSAPNLESLDLGDTKISLAGVKLLAQHNALRALKVLNLADNKIGDEVIDVLISAPFAGQLELLDLRKAGITGAGEKRLKESGIAKIVLI